MEFLTSLYGAFYNANVLWSIIGSILAILVVGYTGSRLIVWTLVIGAILVGFKVSPPALYVFFGLAILFNVTPLRRLIITSGLMKLMKGFMPKISETEKTALEAGVTWIEKDLFSGKPDYKSIIKEPYPHLTAEEKAFVDGPLNRLCEVADDWSIWKDKDIPKEAWDIIKKEKFLGMIIPKEYGGLGFSALAHSEVIMRLASRSCALAITVMVPNSLGPAELLNHYGTPEQKKKLLPRLAVGDEIPCFALTEPTAGSDAGSMKANGVLFKGDDGRLKIRLNWDKRYITLAAIASLLGLAFKLKDPDNLLGKGPDLGITVALVPSNTKGVTIGRRHDPLSVPFYNCPLQGRDVVIDAEEWVVGGVKNAGKGWQMLMECLAAGRGISLPAQSTGTSQMVTRVCSNYATIRKQFGVSIGKFEGIEELLGEVAGVNYILEAMRKFTLGALDKGIKPPVITAMAKYHTTELARRTLTHGMDICGGAAISRGPRNLLAHSYIGAPIGVTVEGANIMTRTLIIFGQGALRSHPWAFKEVSSIENRDLKGFDQAFWGHVAHISRNFFRSVLLSVTRGHLYRAPVGKGVGQYYQKLAWSSATFAIMSDLAMGLLGGSLKTREMITGRYADVLSWMYIGTCVLRRFEADGSKKEDLPYVHYSMQYVLARLQKAFDGIFENMAAPGIGWLFAGPIRAWSHLNSLGTGPNDKLNQKIARLSQVEGEQRDRMATGLYFSKTQGDALKRLEDAFKAVVKADQIQKKIGKAVKAGKLPRIKVLEKRFQEACKLGIITQEELNALKKSEELRLDAIMVDDFSQDEYLGKCCAPVAKSA